jgi:hypothetical protein
LDKPVRDHQNHQPNCKDLPKKPVQLHQTLAHNISPILEKV